MGKKLKENFSENLMAFLSEARVEEAFFMEDGTLELKLEKFFQRFNFKVKEQPEEFCVELSTRNGMPSSLKVFFPYDVPFSLRFSSEDVEKLSDFLKTEIAGKGFKVWNLPFGREYFDGFFFENYGVRKILRHVRAEGKVEEFY